MLHAFPAVGKIFRVQPVGVCRSRDLLTDRSRRLTSVLLCQYWNAKALRFEVGMFYRRLLLQNKGSSKILKWFIWRYGLFIRTLQECKFMEVARWPSTWFHLNSQVITVVTRRFPNWSSARWLLQMLSSQKSCFFSVLMWRSPATWSEPSDVGWRVWNEYVIWVIVTEGLFERKKKRDASAFMYLGPCIVNQIE